MQTLTTIEYADNYFLSKIGTDAWLNSDIETHEKLLIEASRRIYALQGFKYTPELIGLLSEIPEDLQQACCEVALNLAENLNNENPHIVNKRLGITSISFGNDSVSYAESNNNNGFDGAIFNNYAQSILNKYIIKGFRYV